jgi:hypothetical protein
MAHTPGPWKVADRFYILMDDDVACEIAKVCEENLDDDMLGQADADALLIAAAPELLAALKRHIQWQVEPPQGWGIWQDAGDAVARAEGITKKDEHDPQN